MPLSVIRKWILTRNQLTLLERIRIPCWTRGDDQKCMELHGFRDASSKEAYITIIYLRVQRKDKFLHSVVLTSKTRVAPLKTVSILRLKLCSAVLLVETMKQLKKALGWNEIPATYWTDSTTVLSWIQKPATNWKVFVANRVSTIQQKSTTIQ